MLFSLSSPGNVFVIAAILLERHLHSVANYLIVSLAVADLLVACLVMPLSAVYEVSDTPPTRGHHCGCQQPKVYSCLRGLFRGDVFIFRPPL